MSVGQLPTLVVVRLLAWEEDSDSNIRLLLVLKYFAAQFQSTISAIVISVKHKAITNMNTKQTFLSQRGKLLITLALLILSNICPTAYADCQSSATTTPVTVIDETNSVPSSRQLVNGTNTVVDTSTPGQIKVSPTSSGVTAGSYANTNLTVDAYGRLNSSL